VNKLAYGNVSSGNFTLLPLDEKHDSDWWMDLSFQFGISQSTYFHMTKDPCLYFALASIVILSVFLVPLISKALRQPLSLTIDKSSDTTFNPKSIFHFVQVSDVHFSVFHPQRKVNFDKFMMSLRVTQPKFVLNTGDTTDGEGNPFIWHVQQYEDEWKGYHDVMKKYEREWNSTNWFDVRGNHDHYGETRKGLDAMYHKYGISGRKFGRSRLYEFTHKEKFGNYHFIGLDAVANITSLRPYFYFGQFEPYWVEKLKDNIRKASIRSNHTILFGHWPMCAMYSHDFKTTTDLIDIGKDLPVLAHLFGHLHEMYKLAPNGVKTKLDGHLELEVLDFKNNNFMRVVAIDNDIMSFVDSKYNEYPIILITNPKDARFMSQREPLVRMSRGKIRLMVFSPTAIKEVEVSINNVFLGRAIKEEVNLWTIDWAPERYANGLHEILVKATTQDGKTRTVSHEFSLDGTIPPLITYDHYVSRLLAIPWGMALQMLYIAMLMPSLMFMIFTLVTISINYEFDGFWQGQFIKLAKNQPLLYAFLLFSGMLALIYMYELYLFGVPWVFGSYCLTTYYFAFTAKDSVKNSMEYHIIHDDEDGEIKEIHQGDSYLWLHIVALLYCVTRFIDMMPNLMLFSFPTFPNGAEYYIICILFITFRIFE
jgi:predicted MPP superfamily phosphohydrolase